MTRRRLQIGGVAALVVFVDQLTKWWALSRLEDGSVIDVVWTLRFALTYNTGTAFSLGGGSGLGPWIAVLSVAVVIVLVWQVSKMLHGWAAGSFGNIAIGLVAGGALGNVIDRAARGDGGFMSGAVVDFIDLQWWPVFNVADAAICIGIGMLVIGMVFGSGDEAPVGDSQPQPGSASADTGESPSIDSRPADSDSKASS